MRTELNITLSHYNTSGAIAGTTFICTQCGTHSDKFRACCLNLPSNRMKPTDYKAKMRELRARAATMAPPKPKPDKPTPNMVKWSHLEKKEEDMLP